jgi:hypothetical protein
MVQPATVQYVQIISVEQATIRQLAVKPVVRIPNWGSQ